MPELKTSLQLSADLVYYSIDTEKKESRNIDRLEKEESLILDSPDIRMVSLLCLYPHNLLAKGKPDKIDFHRMHFGCDLGFSDNFVSPLIL